MQGYHILIVDDEDIVRDVTSAMLESRGAKTYEATDGLDAIAFYKENLNDIDLVLMDMRMPRMNGIDAFNALLELNPQLKLIFSSGYSQEQEVARLREQHSHVDYLCKPFDKDALIEVVFKNLKSDQHASK